MIVLRKKAPFFCRHQTAWKYDCLSVPLTEAEGELCTAHETAARLAEEKFFNAPIEAPKQEVKIEVRRIWP